MADTTVAAAPQAAAQGANEEKKQPSIIGSIGGIVRMIFFGMAIKYMFFGGSTAPQTDASGKVHHPYRALWGSDQRFDLYVYVSGSNQLDTDHIQAEGELNSLLWFQKGLLYNQDDPERALNLTLSSPLLSHLQNNGSLYAHIFCVKQGYGPFDGFPNKRFAVTASAYKIVQLNEHKARPLYDRKNLISGEFADERIQNVTDEQERLKLLRALPVEYVNYWKPQLMIRPVLEFNAYPFNNLPPHVASSFVIEPVSGNYYPPLYIDYFWFMRNQMVPINATVQRLFLALNYCPIASWKWHIELQVEQSFKIQSDYMGADVSELDEMKRMFIETNPYFLGLTMFISLLHTVFEFLAFKNDIAFWKDNKNLSGLSVRTIFFNAGCQVIILLYLFDNQTSWVILASAFFGTLIEFWKIFKAVNIERKATFPFISFSDKSSYVETETAKFDKEAIRYLSYTLLPLIVGYSIYSLLYESHKSWYSWILGSLVGTVYTFGFILMCPQLYLNYKLKSVAHLPWRMLTYKALNTFIDDLFSFIITMPTMHRLSCFRDDIIFFLFLYQKWKYPVDYHRTNEFGYTPITPEEELKRVEEEKQKMLLGSSSEKQNVQSSTTDSETVSSSSSSSSSSSESVSSTSAAASASSSSSSSSSSTSDAASNSAASEDTVASATAAAAEESTTEKPTVTKRKLASKSRAHN
eukprot:TRINITY_DN1083_c0_g1_i1.p1 TRINITY_DN1083_c0_g1~~TRINITY_DN1083_c0_g1_i1.p1  ORF type:complete len:693 (-),score=204.22 TRINITY_DN1083_c0_g1_i1:48-2126(-)